MKPFERVSQLCDALQERTVTGHARASRFHGNAVHVAGLISPRPTTEKTDRRARWLQLTLRTSVHFLSKYLRMLCPALPMSESSSLKVSQLSKTSLTSSENASRLGYLREQKGEPFLEHGESKGAWQNRPNISEFTASHRTLKECPTCCSASGRKRPRRCIPYFPQKLRKAEFPACTGNKLFINQLPLRLISS